MTTLNLTPKIRNSPLLAVRNFIQSNLMFYRGTDQFGKNDVMTTHKLWNKFKMNNEYKIVIEKFDIDFPTFKELAEPILETYCIGNIKIGPMNQIHFVNKFKNSAIVVNF